MFTKILFTLFFIILGTLVFLTLYKNIKSPSHKDTYIQPIKTIPTISPESPV